MTVQVSRFQVLLLVLQCLPPHRPHPPLPLPLLYPPTLGEGGGGVISQGGGGLVGEEEVMDVGVQT